MRLLSKTIFLFLSVGMLITACNKDDQINEIVPENPNYTPDTTIVNNLMSELVANPSGGLDLGCMSIDFPIGLELQSGATLTVQDQASFDMAMNGQGDDRVVSFVYPMAVQQADGSFVQMQSNYELSASYASCIPDQGWDRAAASGDLIPAYLLGSICLEIVYPVNLIDGDDQPYVANNEAELIDLIVSIHELYFDLPFTVITESGDQVAIIDVDNFFDTVFDCDDITPPVVGDGLDIVGFDCFDLAFPFDVETTDGDVITVNDDNEYAVLVLSGVEFHILFPFSLIDEDGQTILINEELDLIPVLLDCGIIDTTGTSDPCETTPAHVLLFFNTALQNCRYNIDFPLQLEAGGQVFDLNAFNDYFGVYNAYPWDEIEIVYPISITLIADGSTVTFNSDQDICTFIDDCQ